ncbi:MAG: pitrilysin family protein [Gammaproteobacteria bacterium]|nr:pitrilysin family protein [Gammaproteobacteria bacterium]
MRRWILLCVGLCCVSLTQAAPQVFEDHLPNGLRILVQPDHRAPVVTSQVWYKVGSSDEPGGLTGISHMLEHMMFKGTTKVPAGKFSEIIAAHGGQENAFTSRDYTAYFQTLAKESLEVAFKLEADRMRNLLLREEDFRKEVEVVKEERRMRTEDDPNARLYEQFQAIAWPNGGYHHPIIGWMDDLERLRVEDLRRWYRAHYAPNNATLVVVGDVTPEEVKRLALKYFGSLKPSSLAPRERRQALEQAGERRMVLRAPARLPALLMGYRVPVLLDDVPAWEVYALKVLAGVLDGGQSARLQQRLVRELRLAGEVSAGYDADSRLHELFMISAVPSEGVPIGQLEQALRQEVARLREEPVSAEELARVKAQVIAADVYGRDSLFYQAMRLGAYETVGLGYRRLNELVPGIEAVTAEQVQAVARKYLIDDRLTVGVLDPLPLEPGVKSKPAETMGGIRYVR